MKFLNRHTISAAAVLVMATGAFAAQTPNLAFLIRASGRSSTTLIRS